MTDYSKLKVAELKDLVKEKGIASAGLKLKQHYIDALVVHDADGVEDVAEREAPEQGDVEVEEKSEEENAQGVAAPVADNDKDENMPVVVEEKVESPSKTEEKDLPQKDEDRSLEGSEEPTNKRKRRSPTPPMDEESVSKKIRTENEKTEIDVCVKLPEDLDTKATEPKHDEPHPTIPDPAGNVEDAQAALSDDIAAIESANNGEERTALPDTQREVFPQSDTVPSKHAVTSALYIRELVRPLQPNAVREHLLSVAQQSVSTDATIQEFHLDRLKSHAFVLFNSVPAASAVRDALHNKVWPDEPMRKPLWIDYIPEDVVRDWIDTEVNRGDNTRWEVVYSSAGLDTDGPVTASLQEADSGSSNAPTTSRQAVGAGEGMPNAPSGPRRQSSQQQQPPLSRSPEESRRPPNKTFDTLDEMYPFTTTKPKIYYQPVNRELIERRLGEFEKEKSRDWDDRYADPSAYAEGELRRYTFEDGDRLVDGGADFGLFGRSSRGGGGGGRGGGRGRGRGGDRYRGSARR